MEPDQEFREFAKSLMCHGVKFMVIGGYAVTAHGHPRYTGDIDFFVGKSPENAKRMSQFGVPPYRVDILDAIPGVEFEDAYAHREMLPLAGLPIPFISLADLKKNKLATGRHKDLGGLEAMEKIDEVQSNQ